MPERSCKNRARGECVPIKPMKKDDLDQRATVVFDGYLVRNDSRLDEGAAAICRCLARGATHP